MPAILDTALTLGNIYTFISMVFNLIVLYFTTSKIRNIWYKSRKNYPMYFQTIEVSVVKPIENNLLSLNQSL